MFLDLCQRWCLGQRDWRVSNRWYRGDSEWCASTLFLAARLLRYGGAEQLRRPVVQRNTDRVPLFGIGPWVWRNGTRATPMARRMIVSTRIG